MKHTSVVPGVAVLLALMLSACATSIPVTVEHPSLVDMKGITSISVLDFSDRRPRFFDSYPEGISPMFRVLEKDRNVGLIVSDAIRRSITRSGRYRVIDVPAWEKPYRFGVDAYIDGSISDYSITNSLSIVVRKDSKGNDVRYWVVRREMRLAFSYRVVEASTGRILDSLQKEGSTFETTDKREFEVVVFNDYDMLQRILDRIIPEIQKEILPWSEQAYLTIQNNDKEPKFKLAEEYVKNKQYEQAVNLYLDLYRNKNEHLAGYNAALVLFAMNQKERAIELMRQVSDVYNYPKAKYYYTWMLNAYEDERKVRKSGPSF